MCACACTRVHACMHVCVCSCLCHTHTHTHSHPVFGITYSIYIMQMSSLTANQTDACNSMYKQMSKGMYSHTHTHTMGEREGGREGERERERERACSQYLLIQKTQRAMWPCFTYQIKYLVCLECSEGGGSSQGEKLRTGSGERSRVVGSASSQTRSHLQALH